MRYVLTAVVALFLATPVWAMSGEKACDLIEAEMAEAGVILVCTYAPTSEDSSKYMYGMVIVSYPEDGEALLMPTLAIVTVSYDDNVPTPTTGIGVIVGDDKIGLEMRRIRMCRSKFRKEPYVYAACINSSLHFF